MSDGEVEIAMPRDPRVVLPAAETQLVGLNVRDAVEGLALASAWISIIGFSLYLGFFIRLAVFPFVYERAVPLLGLFALFLTAFYLQYFSVAITAAVVAAGARARRAHAAVAAWRRGGGAYAPELSED